MLIKFDTSSINFLEFELALKKFYVDSYKDSFVKFTFDNVEYISLPQLCYLFGWIENLLKSGVNVELELNKDTKPNFLNVINNYGFFLNLQRYSYKNLKITSPFNINVKLNNELLKKDTPIVHLSLFENRKASRNFLSRLHPESLPLFPTENANEKLLVARTGIRDIFLKELGENVFDHAGGSPAIIAVSKKTKENLSSSSNSEVLKQYAGRIESNYFIEVVVVDFGIGIPKSIRKTFLSDQTAKNILSAKSELSFLEYAFWKDTSRKIERPFENKIKEIIESNDISKHFIAPTGLFFVKQLAFETKGFLSCRSGRSIFSYDFSTGSEQKVDPKLWRDKKIVKGRLEKIDGNIIYAIIPLINIDFKLLRNSVKYFDNYIVPKASKYLNIAKVMVNFDDENDAVYSIINDIKEANREAIYNSCIIIDFAFSELQARSLYWIVIFCMYYSDIGKNIVIVDFSAKVNIQLVKSQIEKDIKDYLNIPLNSIQYYSTNKEESIIIEHSPKQTLLLVSGKWLRNELIAKRNKIVDHYLTISYKAKEKVYLPGPSTGFLEGYYELADVLFDTTFTYLIASLMYTKLKNKNISVLILTTNILLPAAQILSGFLNVKNDLIFMPKNEASLVKIRLKLNQLKGTALIIADVTVTCNTLLHYLNIIGKETIVSTIIDGRCKVNTKNSIQDIISIANRDLNFYPTKPKKWSYDDIRLVDPITHKILYEKREINQKSWEGKLTTDSLEDISKHKGYVRSGHFCYGFNCYLYFFHMISIVQNYGKEICLRIIENVKKVIEIQQENPRRVITRDIDLSSINYIVYPQENKAAEIICKEIHTYLGGDCLYLPRYTDSVAGTQYTEILTCIKRKKMELWYFLTPQLQQQRP